MTEKNKFFSLTLERVLVEIRQRAQILEGEPEDRQILIEEIVELGRLKESLENKRIDLLIQITKNTAAECTAALVRFGWDLKLAEEILTTKRIR